MSLVRHWLVMPVTKHVVYNITVAGPVLKVEMLAQQHSAPSEGSCPWLMMPGCEVMAGIRALPASRFIYDCFS